MQSVVPVTECRCSSKFWTRNKKGPRMSSLIQVLMKPEYLLRKMSGPHCRETKQHRTGENCMICTFGIYSRLLILLCEIKL